MEGVWVRTSIAGRDWEDPSSLPGFKATVLHGCSVEKVWSCGLLLGLGKGEGKRMSRTLRGRDSILHDDYALRLSGS